MAKSHLKDQDQHSARCEMEVRSDRPDELMNKGHHYEVISIVCLYFCALSLYLLPLTSTYFVSMPRAPHPIEHTLFFILLV